MAACYDRALDKDAFALLAPGGPLRFFITDAAGAVDDRYAYDIQIRKNNTLMYYHGTTRVLTVCLGVKGNSPPCRLDAAASYRKLRSYGDLAIAMDAGNTSHMREMLVRYLADVAPRTHVRYYRNHKEGYWQNRLCVDFGRHWTAEAPWLVIDRECVIGFGDGNEKRTFYEDKLESYTDIRDRFQEQDEATWGKPAAKTLGDELDLLAIGADGRLLAIELKHGSNPGGVYWGPLQVMAYQDAFAQVLPGVSKRIRDLVEQKIRLGLLPQEAGARVAGDGLTCIRPVLAVAEPNPRSSCWHKLGTVLSALECSRPGVSHELHIVDINAEAEGGTVVERTKLVSMPHE